MAKQLPGIVDPRLAKALSHPMRTRILTILNEQSGAFDARADRHLSRTALALDPRCWAELNAFLQRVHAEAERIVAQSAERLADSGATSIASRLVMMHFEVPG